MIVRGGEGNKAVRKGRGGGTTVTGTERKTDGRIMRGQAGSENNK